MSWDRRDITIRDVDGDELSWSLHDDLYRLLLNLDIQEADRVRVSVEFDDYTATHIVQLDLDPRALLARIEELEQQIKGLTT